MNKKTLDKKMKFAPSLKEEGNFTQISNHIILNPDLTAEEKELILVFLISKNDYELTIDGYCEDLNIKPRQVIKTINSLIQKRFFEIDDKYCRLNIVRIDNQKYKLKAEKSVLKDSSSPEKDVLQDNKNCATAQIQSEKDVLEDNKSCAVTQVLPEKVALEDTNTCVATQVLLEVSLEYQGIPEEEKTNNKTGSEARTYTKGARPSDNTIEDSVNAVFEINSSVGRTPYVGAPPECPVRNSNDFFDNLESCFTSTETNRRSPYVAAPIVSEFWTDENTTNLNYRWYKKELDNDDNFNYTFIQFEELLAIALFSYMVNNDMEIPTNNNELQHFGKFIGIKNDDSYHINKDDFKGAIQIYTSKTEDNVETRDIIFDTWKLKSPSETNIQPAVEPVARHLPANPVSAFTNLDRAKQIAIGLRKQRESQSQL